MFKYLSLLALVALSSMGCAPKPPSHYTVFLDPAFTVDQTIDIEVALQEWEQSVPVTFDVKIGSTLNTNDPNQIVIHASTLAAIDAVHHDTRLGTTVYFANDDHADIYYGVDETNPAKLHVEYRHELGHAMGLIHTGPGSLMCFEFQCAADHVTPTDVTQWEELRQ